METTLRDSRRPLASLEPESLASQLLRSLDRRRDLYVNIDGLRIRYWDVGEGDPMLLLHGLGASAETWLLNVDSLASRYRVLVPDLPGSGLSDKTGFEYTVAWLARFVVGFLDATGVERACVVGNSMGGLAAIQAALDYPDRIDHLVLVDSAGLGREIGTWFRIASLPIIGKLATDPSEHAAQDMLAALISNANEVPRDLAAAWVNATLAPEVVVVAREAVRAGVGAFGQRETILLRERLSEIRVPTMIVWGSDDPVFPVSHALSAQRLISGSILRVFAGCRHCPPFERHNDFNHLLLRFLDPLDELI
jgi:pimeloyl-ACP methyl ester carboxylesterase